MEFLFSNWKKVLFVFFGFILFMGSWEIVPSGSRGVVIHAGKISDTVLDEGFTFKMPFITTIKPVSVRIQETSIKTEAASKDMQNVHTTLSLNWHISPDKVNTVFKQIGESSVIEQNIIEKQVSEVLKAATATMSAEEILSKRNELKTKIDKDLESKLAQFNLSIDNVNLADFKFEPEFNKAVEEKQVAEQKAKQAEYEAKKTEVDSRAKVVQAKAEAEANMMKQKTLTPQLIQYEMMQRWDGKLPMVQGSGGGIFNITMPERN